MPNQIHMPSATGYLGYIWILNTRSLYFQILKISTDNDLIYDGEYTEYNVCLRLFKLVDTTYFY